MIWVRLVAFLSLTYLAMRAGLFTLQVPETDTKWDVVWTFSAAIVLLTFVWFA